MMSFEATVLEAMPYQGELLRCSAPVIHYQDGDGADVIDHVVGEISVSDLQERCPTVSVDLIRRVLRQERDHGRVECLGRGPRARWRKIV